MRWLGGVAVACAWVAASLPAAAQSDAPSLPRVAVHFEAQREGVRLYEVDPARPPLHRVTPLCDSPCERVVTPLGRTYFYDGEGTGRSIPFTIPTRYSDVTIHADARDDTMRSAGVGTLVAGALTFAGGGFLIGFGTADGVDGGISDDTEEKVVLSGAAAICLGALAVVVGASLMHEAKPSARVEPGRHPAVSLRLGPTGPALVF